MANKKILIVEDNQDIVRILQKRLKDNDFSVDVAERGYSALGFLRNEESPDAIILDLMLPERSGMDLLSSLKSKWPMTEIFIFSAHEEYKTQLALYKEYITAFFCKSDGMDNLIAAKKEALKDQE